MWGLFKPSRPNKKIKKNGFAIDCKRCCLYGKQSWTCSRGDDYWHKVDIDQAIGRVLRMEQKEKE